MRRVCGPSHDMSRSALAALAARRQAALARRGKAGAAFANHMHSTLPHYLHQVRPGGCPGKELHDEQQALLQQVCLAS